jgi:hypothetical protein
MAAKRNASQKKRLTTLAATTKEQKKKLLESLANMPTVESACRKADVGRATYYDWLKSDSVFASEAAKAKKKGREMLSDIAVSKLMQLIGDGNITAIIFWLKYNNEWFANPKFYHHIEIKEDPGVDDKIAKQIKETMVKFISTAAEKGQADRFLHPERYNKKRNG